MAVPRLVFAQEVLPLRGVQPAPAPAQSAIIKLSGPDAPLYQGLDLVSSVRVERDFSAQTVTIDILNFPSAEEGFSAFTFLQTPGAKTYDAMVDCYIQGKEIVFWKASRVLRSRFGNIQTARLSAYVNWMRTQYAESAPAPGIYGKLPENGRLAASRRYLVRDWQLDLVCPGFPEGVLALNQGNRLMLARYRRGQSDYWAGWLIFGGTGREALPGRGSSRSDDGWVIRMEGGGASSPIYIGPDDPALIKGLLVEVAQSRDSPNEIDPARFFRRDTFSYGDLILAGFKMVFLLLMFALVVGVGSGVVHYFLRRLRGKKVGLADEQFVRIGLDGVTGVARKKDNFPSK